MFFQIFPIRCLGVKLKKTLPNKTVKDMKIDSKKVFKMTVLSYGIFDRMVFNSAVEIIKDIYAR